jgi:hypothetical protein
MREILVWEVKKQVVFYYLFLSLFLSAKEKKKSTYFSLLQRKKNALSTFNSRGESNSFY